MLAKTDVLKSLIKSEIIFAFLFRNKKAEHVRQATNTFIQTEHTSLFQFPLTHTNQKKLVPHQPSHQSPNKEDKKNLNMNKSNETVVLL